MGIKDLVITSDGIKYSNEKVLMKYEKILKRLQRKLSRQVKEIKNYLNTIANEIVNEHDIIVIESLLVKYVVIVDIRIVN